MEKERLTTTVQKSACKCNCHNHKFRKKLKISKHKDCRECKRELIKESKMLKIIKHIIVLEDIKKR